MKMFSLSGMKESYQIISLSRGYFRSNILWSRELRGINDLPMATRPLERV